MIDRLIKRWRKNGARPEPTAGKESVLNPATRVTIPELVGLQRYARGLDLRRRQPARAQLAGNHPSRIRGRGMDYQESRSYQPGDDIRNMDWRVTARAGRPHTKLFQEERERPVVVFMDLSPSLFFATRGALKSVIAARAATLIAWAAARQGDRIGALLFNGGHHELRPRSGHRGALQLVHALAEQTDPLQGMTGEPHPDGLNEALRRLRRIVRPGSLVFLISDFYALDEASADHLLRLRRHNDLAAIQVVDPLELAPPPPGRYAVTDGSSNGILDTRSGKGRDHYSRYFQQHHQLLKATMRRHAIPLLALSTDDDVNSVMQLHFGSAQGHQGKGKQAA